METYPFYSPKGEVYAFEIGNIFLSVRKVATILRSINGVTDIRIRRLFSSPSDIHIEFKYQDSKFMVWEPYADSSRYWIGPKDDDSQMLDIKELRGAFIRYQPNTVLRFIAVVVGLLFVIVGIYLFVYIVQGWWSKIGPLTMILLGGRLMLFGILNR